MSINRRQDKIEKAEQALSNLLSIIVCDATKYSLDMKSIFVSIRNATFDFLYNTNETSAINNIIHMIDTNTGLLSTEDVSRIDAIDGDISGQYTFAESVIEMNRIIRSAPIYEQFKNFFIELLVLHERGNYEIAFFSVAREMTDLIETNEFFESSDGEIPELCMVLSNFLSDPIQLLV